MAGSFSLFGNLMGTPQRMQMGSLADLMANPAGAMHQAVAPKPKPRNGEMQKGEDGKTYRFEDDGAEGRWMEVQQESATPRLDNVKRNLGDMFSPENLSAWGAMAGGRTFGDSLGGFLQHTGQNLTNVRAERKATEQKNKTLEWLRKQNPEVAQAVEMGALSIGDAYNAMRSGKAEIINAGDGQLYNATTGQWITAPNSGAGGDFAQREQAARAYGLTPEHPAWQSFILTGRMPREDQAPLTATDKKAILEADEMVAANENALSALERAEALNDTANAGVGAGSRAWAGNNLPDLMVPDAISSPESSAATAEMDNLILGQALASLKATFGAAPTEGERKILVELQASSTMPRNVRKQVLERAKALAARRLEFNRKRADELRGGTFYKQGGGTSGGGANRTSSGLEWSIEGQ